MKYEHQINWADAYGTNLDACISRLVRNGSIYLLSTPTYHVSEGMENSEARTSY